MQHQCCHACSGCRQNSDVIEYLKPSIGRRDMSTTVYEKQPNSQPIPHIQNQQVSSRASQHINWPYILTPRVKKWTAYTVRRYLKGVYEKINEHFAVVMDGEFMGSIQITRLNRLAGHPPVNVILSVWRCLQLYPQKISISWEEDGKIRRIDSSALSLWLKCPIRKNVQPAISSSIISASPLIIVWLQKMLLLANSGDCPITFNALNIRQSVYESFWNVVGPERTHEWQPKTISQAIYNILPSSRPKKRQRRRFKGKPVIDIPSIDVCRTAVAQQTAH